MRNGKASIEKCENGWLVTNESSVEYKQFVFNNLVDALEKVAELVTYTNEFSMHLQKIQIVSEAKKHATPSDRPD